MSHVTTPRAATAATSLVLGISSLAVAGAAAAATPASSAGETCWVSADTAERITATIGSQGCVGRPVATDAPQTALSPDAAERRGNWNPADVGDFLIDFVLHRRLQIARDRVERPWVYR